MSSLHHSALARTFVSESDSFFILESQSDALGNFAYFENELRSNPSASSMHGDYYIGNTHNSTLVISKEHTFCGQNHLSCYPSNNTHPVSIQIDANQSYRGCTLVHRDNADCTLTVNAELQSTYFIIGSNEAETSTRATLNGCGSLRGKVQVQATGTLQPSHDERKELTLIGGADFSSEAQLHVQISDPSKHTYLNSAKPITFGKGSKILIEFTEGFELRENCQYKFQIIRGVNNKTPRINDYGVQIALTDQSLDAFVKHHVDFDPATGALTIVTGPSIRNTAHVDCAGTHARI